MNGSRLFAQLIVHRWLPAAPTGISLSGASLNTRVEVVIGVGVGRTRTTLSLTHRDDLSKVPPSTLGARPWIAKLEQTAARSKTILSAAKHGRITIAAHGSIRLTTRGGTVYAGDRITAIQHMDPRGRAASSEVWTESGQGLAVGYLLANSGWSNQPKVQLTNSSDKKQQQPTQGMFPDGGWFVQNYRGITFVCPEGQLNGTAPGGANFSVTWNESNHNIPRSAAPRATTRAPGHAPSRIQAPRSVTSSTTATGAHRSTPSTTTRSPTRRARRRRVAEHARRRLSAVSFQRSGRLMQRASAIRGSRPRHRGVPPRTPIS